MNNCSDHLQRHDLTLLQAHLGDDTLNTCEDFRPYCSEFNLPLLRHVCGNTCGCNNPLSPLRAINGCPTGCDVHPAYQEAVLTIPCKDQTADWLHELGYLRDKDWREFWLSRGQGEMISAGCAAIAQYPDSRTIFCLGRLELRIRLSFRLFCPVACGCREEGIDTDV